VHDHAERVERLAVEQHVELDQIVGAVTGDLVVHRSVAAAHALQLVVEVEDHFRERHLVRYDYVILGRVIDA
jgi:hypothetical protein